MPKKMYLFYLLSLIIIFVLPLAIKPALAADEIPERTMELLETCASCHGENGIAVVAGVPHLAGQNAPYLKKSLNNYVSGERLNANMHSALVGLTNDDMASLSLYFASLPPFFYDQTQEDETYVADDPFAISRDNIEMCASCHESDGTSRMEGVPGLAGQAQGYLANTMRQYRDGQRPDATMQYFVEEMSEIEIDNIALYYSRLDSKVAETTWTGDPYAGHAPADKCSNCHGENGNAISAQMGRIAGQDATYLEASIHAYLSGTREHDTMREILETLSPTEINNIAAYYASQQAVVNGRRRPFTAVKWAERCNRCHGVGSDSLDENIPKLAGQSESYLINALKLYHSSARLDPLMNAMSHPLSEREILDLAAYYARLQPQ